jgi:hypothetical protein
MQLLDDHLWKFYDEGTCDADNCVERARNPSDFQAKIEAKLRGQAGPGGLGAKASESAAPGEGKA